MNSITDRYLRFGLPAGISAEQREAWKSYRLGQPVPMRLLPVNGEQCDLVTEGGAVCGRPLLIDASCPNHTEHRNAVAPNPYAALLTEWAAARFKVDATEISEVRMSYSDEYGQEGVIVTLTVEMRDGRHRWPSNGEDELEPIGKLLTALIAAMNKG
jgi:hypothetical protein